MDLPNLIVTYEYITVSLPIRPPHQTDTQLADELNRYGEVGWELVSLRDEHWLLVLMGRRPAAYAVFKKRIITVPGLHRSPKAVAHNPVPSNQKISTSLFNGFTPRT